MNGEKTSRIEIISTPHSITKANVGLGVKYGFIKINYTPEILDCHFLLFYHSRELDL